MSSSGGLLVRLLEAALHSKFDVAFSKWLENYVDRTQARRRQDLVQSRPKLNKQA